MRYLVTFLWAFVLGQVVGYLGSSLTNTTYNFALTTLLSFVVAVVVILIGTITTPETKKNQLQ